MKKGTPYKDGQFGAKSGRNNFTSPSKVSGNTMSHDTPYKDGQYGCTSAPNTFTQPSKVSGNHNFKKGTPKTSGQFA